MEVIYQPFLRAQRLATFKHSSEGAIIQVQNNVSAFFVSLGSFPFFF